jgi:DNA-binding PadR family transcriptional regulator
MELSKTSYVILGMLKLGRSTGYDIKQLVDVSTRFFWAASYGQIYPELKALEAAGLIEGVDDPESGRRRRAYSLTRAGEEELHDWLTSSEPLTIELRHEGWLKYFFADALSREEQLALVRRMREAHEAMVEELQAVCPVAEEARDEEGELFPFLTLEWGIALGEFFVDWCARMEERLTAGDLAKAGR